MVDMAHQHNWQHLQTRYIKEEYRNRSDFYRVDEFYCTVCMEIREKSQMESKLNPPLWFDTGKMEVRNCL